MWGRYVKKFRDIEDSLNALGFEKKRIYEVDFLVPFQNRREGLYLILNTNDGSFTVYNTNRFILVATDESNIQLNKGTYDLLLSSIFTR